MTAYRLTPLLSDRCLYSQRIIIFVHGENTPSFSFVASFIRNQAFMYRAISVEESNWFETLILSCIAIEIITSAICSPATYPEKTAVYQAIHQIDLVLGGVFTLEAAILSLAS